eukprot:403338134
MRGNRRNRNNSNNSGTAKNNTSSQAQQQQEGLSANQKKKKSRDVSSSSPKNTSQNDSSGYQERYNGGKMQANFQSKQELFESNPFKMSDVKIHEEDDRLKYQLETKRIAESKDYYSVMTPDFNEDPSTKRYQQIVSNTDDIFGDMENLTQDLALDSNSFNNKDTTITTAQYLELEHSQITEVNSEYEVTQLSVCNNPTQNHTENTAVQSYQMNQQNSQFSFGNPKEESQEFTQQDGISFQDQGQFQDTFGSQTNVEGQFVNFGQDQQYYEQNQQLNFQQQRQNTQSKDYEESHYEYDQYQSQDFGNYQEYQQKDTQQFDEDSLQEQHQVQHQDYHGFQEQERNNKHSASDAIPFQQKVSAQYSFMQQPQIQEPKPRISTTNHPQPQQRNSNGQAMSDFEKAVSQQQFGKKAFNTTKSNPLNLVARSNNSQNNFVQADYVDQSQCGRPSESPIEILVKQIIRKTGIKEEIQACEERYQESKALVNERISEIDQAIKAIDARIEYYENLKVQDEFYFQTLIQACEGIQISSVNMESLANPEDLQQFEANLLKKLQTTRNHEESDEEEHSPHQDQHQVRKVLTTDNAMNDDYEDFEERKEDVHYQVFNSNSAYDYQARDHFNNDNLQMQGAFGQHEDYDQQQEDFGGNYYDFEGQEDFDQ